MAAGLSSSEAGLASLGPEILATVAASFAVSLVLSLLLVRSLREPLSRMLEATRRVQDGEFDFQVPLTTSDEVGEWTAGFNEMVAGLAERERMRSTLGTYLDPQVAERLLAEGTQASGKEVTVTVLFLDVRDFTAYAEKQPPHESLAALNRLFGQIVPIIADHGGHIDKFIGDGLLAIFGAPTAYPDHADRALEAALEIEHRLES